METKQAGAERRRKVVGLAVAAVLVAVSCYRSAAPPSAQSKAKSEESAAPSVAKSTEPTAPSAAAPVAARGVKAEAPKETAGQPAAGAPPVSNQQRGAQLYAQHCAGCHGDKGDGLGTAAQFLDPKPRNFRAGGFRLISAAAKPPRASLADIEAVLVRGMPGSAMVSWSHLPEPDRKLLAEQVLQFRRDGARDIAIQIAKEQGEDPDEDQIKEFIAEITAPVEPVKVPDLGQPTAETIARGKKVFLERGCAPCHGEDGKGGGQEKMLTSDGYPQRPRDLTLGIYKGEHDPASIYRRLRLGLPGSAMPANELLTDQEITDCVHFVLSLSTEEARNANIMRRQGLVAKKVGQSPSAPDDAAWKDAPAAKIVVAPLWWVTGYQDPGLVAQALHDGKTLSLRLTWQDPTKNDAPYRVDQFEDLVAVQLTTVGAGNEPFIAMGDKAHLLDMWLWRAGWQTPYPESDSLMDTYPFEDAATKAVAGPKAPDFLTARAAGNLNVNADRKQSAGNLGAKGFGTLTFRPKTSQRVTAKAVHRDGSWSVVLSRPLAVGAEEGTALKPGDTCSIAFAIWDGEVHDRDGQKKISIWNDLVLEQ